MATSWSVLGLELTPAAGGIGSRASRLVGSGALTGGLAGNLAGRGLCEREEKGRRIEVSARVVARSGERVGSSSTIAGRGERCCEKKRGRHDPRPVRVRSRGHSLAATAHFMERDMQAILCVVVTVCATGVVCDYAPCANALRREKHAPRRFPTGRIDRPCTFSANQIAFLRRSRY